MADATPATPAAPPATPAGQPQPIIVKTATGQEYKGNTYEEVVAELVRAQENATRTIAEQNQRLQSAPTPSAPTQSPDDTWNPTRYYELLAQDPMAASAYQRKHDHEYQRLQKFAEVVEEGQMVNEFKSVCPEFPETPQASEAVVQVANNIMAQRHVPMSTELLVMAHHICLNQKAYQPVTPNIVPNTPPPNMPPPPPPASSSATPVGGELSEDQLLSMPREQFEALLREKGFRP